MQYLPALKATLTAPLLAGEKEGIQPVVEEMHSYALSKVLLCPNRSSCKVLSYSDLELMCFGYRMDNKLRFQV